MRDSGATHEVANQSPELVDFDPYAADEALRTAVQVHGASWAEERLTALGRWAGSRHARRLSERANRYPPVLHTHDARGHRIDEVEFHPAYHELLGTAISHRLADLPYVERRPGAHVARCALNHLFHNADIGVLCPVTMTFAAVPALRREQVLAAEWEPRLTSGRYDPGFVPAAGKAGSTCGMAMTEKQGGSDVRASTTVAEPLGDGAYNLTGHKWFCSAPMSDAFLTLAQTGAGPTCFFVPRFTPDGDQNAVLIQRLKDKLGNRSNASSEIEYRGTYARIVGAEGDGVRTILEMVHHTRLDTAVSAAAIMRRATLLAVHHASHRTAFQKRLVDHPAMRRTLADLALECEGATALAMRVAHAFDRAADEEQQAFARAAVAIAKFALCKRCPMLVAEALEVHGGNGYVEAGPMAALYREAPLNGIWEGTGNVMALDVLRAFRRDERALHAVVSELRRAEGADARVDAHAGRLVDRLSGGLEEADARRTALDVATALQASLLLRHRPSAVAEGFVTSRLSTGTGAAFGLLPPDIDEGEILSRALPQT
ncbi:acyl-CoA dehydrogenase family protein [Lutibaculum baratangense]|uniref:Acyl-CoA dehydrogenase n=1 Tax=Lutibaculum baratangense AMV1 TaxID=631454 RepID=V4RTY9_9HYPH|nr:acyl-CoA dehydrogenase family protein [Lutibaculum baratangense]ESR26560.1 Acyl-CoA dehydrogenase [Lutibaculum baratangense AMV1]